jgi:hypothetical protein
VTKASATAPARWTSGFTLEVPAGEYVVSWKDVEVDVVVR